MRGAGGRGGKSLDEIGEGMCILAYMTTRELAVSLGSAVAYLSWNHQGGPMKRAG